MDGASSVCGRFCNALVQMFCLARVVRRNWKSIPFWDGLAWVTNIDSNIRSLIEVM